MSVREKESAAAMPRTTLLSNIPTARRDESNLYTDSMVKRRPVSCSDTTRPTQDRNHCEGEKVDADKGRVGTNGVVVKSNTTGMISIVSLIIPDTVFGTQSGASFVERDRS